MLIEQEFLNKENIVRTNKLTIAYISTYRLEILETKVEIEIIKGAYY